MISSIGMTIGDVPETDDGFQDVFDETSQKRTEILSQSILEKAEEKRDTDTVEVVIRLDPHEFERIGVDGSLNYHEKGTEFVNYLRHFTEEKQSDVRTFLEEGNGKVINSFWMANAILAEVEYGSLENLARLDTVWRVHENFEIEIHERGPDRSDTFYQGSEKKWMEIIENHTLSEGSTLEGSDNDLTWGLESINVTDVWDLGRDGSGIRVAVSDTGVDIEHPDLEGKMVNLDEDDPHHPGGWIEIDSNGYIVEDSKPHDTQYHGTHVSGTVLGGNASGTHIGVAPGAELMHALVMPGGGATFSQILSGLEWKAEPYDRHGEPLHEIYGGNVSDYRPHIASMSWGGSGYMEEMEEPMMNLKSAGVVPVASIGNDGDGNFGSPGAIYETFGIGATDQDDEIADFSGGGIVEDGRDDTPEEFVKPDFAAPGVEVLSAFPEEGYQEISGTSMAAPHVAGIIALIYHTHLSVDDIYTILEESADYREDGDYLNETKNTRYGHGIVDAGKAAEHISYYLAHDTVGKITNESAKLRGELLDMPEDEVQVFFKYRALGEEGWSAAEPVTLHDPGLFQNKIDGLEKATTYEYKAVGNWIGEQNETLTRTFTTHRDVEIITLPDEDLTNDQVTLRGLVKGVYLEQTEVFFRYRKLGGVWNEIELGEVTDYQDLSFELDNLENLTTYEYQAVAEAGGKEFFGGTIQFTTIAPKPEWSEDDNAYMISNAPELQWMKNEIGENYILVNDIDASETEEWFGGLGFEPICDRFFPFRGNLSGDGYTIYDLYINRPEKEDVGLFGSIHEYTEISDLHLRDVNITGGYVVGSLVGYSSGVVYNSSSTGYVNGDSYIGGLAGIKYNLSDQYFNSTVENSFTSGTVSGLYGLGGLVGGNFGSYVNSSYSNCEVISEADYVGGLISINVVGRVENSYATGNVSGKRYVGGLAGTNEVYGLGERSYSLLKNSSSSGDVSGEFVVGGLVGLHLGQITNSYSVGDIVGDQFIGGLTGAGIGIVDNSHYNIDEVLINDENHITVGGIFDEQYQDWIDDMYLDIDDYSETLVPSGEYFEINSVDGLHDILGFADRNDHRFRLSEDIDLSDGPDFYIPYLGADFDGGGHTISNLTIDKPFLENIGLFGYSESTEVNNLEVVDAHVTGYRHVGVLIGRSTDLTVENCITAGSVIGERLVGGLIGESYESTVLKSYSKSEVIGDSNVGGLIGSSRGGGEIYNSYADSTVYGSSLVGGLVGHIDVVVVSDSYATGDVTGNSYVGGLVGYCWGTIIRVYSTGYVGGDWGVGGLVGYNRGVVMNSFWDTVSSEIRRSDGGIGKTTDELVTKETFTEVGWDFKEDWDIIEYETYPYLRWQGEDSYPYAPKTVFNVEITDHEELVPTGRDMSVEYTVTNDKLISDTQIIEFLVDGEIQNTEEVELGSDGFKIWDHNAHTSPVWSVHHSDGVVYSGSLDRSVTAYDSEDQEILWRHWEHDGATLSVHAEDGIVYSGSSDNTVMAYDEESEEKQWMHDEHDSMVMSIYVEDGVVYSGSLNGTVIAYDGEAQELLWKHDLHEDEVYSVYHRNGVVCSGSLDGTVIAYDIETQSWIGGHSHHDGAVQSVYVEEGVIYSGSSTGEIIAYDLIPRRLLWVHAEHNDEVRSVYVQGGVVYSGSLDNSVIAYDTGDQRTLWKHWEHDGGVYTVHAEDGTVYSGGMSGSVLAYSEGDLYEGEFRWDTSGKEPGEYEVEVSSEEDTDQVTVKVVEGNELVVEEPHGEGDVYIDDELVILYPHTEAYLDEEEVTIVAEASENWNFKGWDIDDSLSEEEELNLTIDGDKVVTPIFELNTYDLELEEVGEGSVELDPYHEEYTHGTEVNLTAVPSEGWYFVGWGGDHEASEEQIELTMDGVKNLTAHFELKTYTLNVKEVGDGSVIIEPYNEEYEHGDEVNLTALPEDGYEFVGWSGDYEGYEEEINLIMDDIQNLTAHFQIKTYSLEIDQIGDGSVEVEPVQEEYEHGVEVNLTAHPGEGYIFDGWSIDYSDDERINLTMKDDIELDVYFLRKPFFEVEITDYEDEAVQGDEIVVSFTVNNTGELEDTQTIEFKVNGQTETTREIKLKGTEVYMGEFILTAEEPGEIDIGISSDDDEFVLTSSILIEDEDILPLWVWVIMGLIVAAIVAIVVLNRPGKDDENDELIEMEKEIEDMERDIDNESDEILDDV